MDPDELYTLRAQFWLGHYGLCLEEGKATARRPMSAALKAEREEMLIRARIAQGDDLEKVVSDTSGPDRSPAVKALNLLAQYDLANGDEKITEDLVQQMKSLVSYDDTSLQLHAAQLFLRHRAVREALQCVHLGTTMEHLALSLQIYLSMDRLDLAKERLDLLAQADEDAVLAQLGTVFCEIAKGRTGAEKALHTLGMLTEQYGNSPFLNNVTACAHMTAGNYAAAETVLVESREEGGSSKTDADTLINLIACSAQQGKDTAALLEEFRKERPNHSYLKALERVDGAFERESLKYAVS